MCWYIPLRFISTRYNNRLDNSHSLYRRCNNKNSLNSMIIVARGTISIRTAHWGIPRPNGPVRTRPTPLRTEFPAQNRFLRAPTRCSTVATLHVSSTPQMRSDPTGIAASWTPSRPLWVCRRKESSTHPPCSSSSLLACRPLLARFYGPQMIIELLRPVGPVLFLSIPSVIHSQYKL